MAARRRLDAELVRRGLAASRAQARELVERGKVTVGGAPAPKPTRLVDPGEAVEVAGDGPRFVSRGGEKLDAALDHFGRGQTEEEEVLGPHVLADFHVRTVQRADGGRAVQGKLHVAGARRLFPCGRDLFR